MRLMMAIRELMTRFRSRDSLRRVFANTHPLCRRNTRPENSIWLYDRSSTVRFLNGESNARYLATMPSTEKVRLMAKTLSLSLNMRKLSLSISQRTRLTYSAS